MRKEKYSIFALIALISVFLASCPDSPQHNTTNGKEIEIEQPNPSRFLGSVVILQAFGTGNNTDAGVSHSFIELYNKSDETVSLSGHTLQYSEGGSSWKVLSLEGKSIPPESSFLILGRRTTNRNDIERYGLLQLNEADADMRWMDGTDYLRMSNRNFKIFLVESTEALTIVNPFDVDRNRTGKKAKGYADLLGSNDNDGTVNIDAFETSNLSDPSVRGPYLASKGKSVRRIDLNDTDDNNRDFVRVEWRQRQSDIDTGEVLSADDFEALRPRSTKDGAWNPVHFRDPVGSNNATIGLLVIGGVSTDPGTPAASFSAVTGPGSVDLAGTVAGAASVEITLAAGATFKTAKVSGSGTPEWNNSISPAYSFSDGDFLYIEVTSRNGNTRQVYKITVSVMQVSSTVTVNGSYNLILNSAIPQQRVVIEAYKSVTETSRELVSAVNASMTDQTWAMQIPSGETVWFRVAVTDQTDFTFGSTVLNGPHTYNSAASGPSLTLGPFSLPVLTELTLINADAVNSVKRNKTAPGTNTNTNSSIPQITYNTINQTTGEIIFGNTVFTTVSVPNIINFHALAAAFIIPADCKLYVGNVEQVSGVTTNNYYNDVVFTVVAPDNARKTYTVASTPDDFRIVGTRSWQTHGFGVMNITTTNTMLGLPTGGGNTKLNIVWNPTGSYTYISPRGRVVSGGTDIRVRGNYSLRAHANKSYNLRLNNAAGFDYYDYKTDQYITLPSHRRWALLAHEQDSTRIRGTLGWEMGRRVLTNMGWQPHGDFVHFFFNGTYRGVYILAEIIKPEQGRLGITPVASNSNHNGGFIAEINNFYWYMHESGPAHEGDGFLFDEMYSFMTSHLNPVGPWDRYQQGVVFQFKEPDSNLGWYYNDPPTGSGNLSFNNAAHAINFPRRGIVLASRLSSGSAYNRASAPVTQWIVPDEYNSSSANRMGVRNMAPQNGPGVNGSRTLSQVYPGYANSAFVAMAKKIQDAEDSIYAREWGTNGAGGYHDHIDIASFIDYHIAQEMASNWEFPILNGQYMHFDPSAGPNGKLKMGPLWDFDQAWNNGQRGIHPGFMQKTPFWYKELMGWEFHSASENDYRGIFRADRLDPYYVAQLKLRWNAVRGALATELHAYIDAQNARFARLMSHDGVNFNQAPESPVSITGRETTEGVFFENKRIHLKTDVTNMINALNLVITGY
ncbi:MAG: CotH kinase family protein [Treponema sp.]|nr:CotH kinase family protein [Treponema sp.]